MTDILSEDGLVADTGGCKMKKQSKDKKKKTKIMELTTKGGTRTNYACSKCFSFVDEEDKFCWNCGAEFDTEDIAYDSEDLKTESNQK